MKDGINGSLTKKWLAKTESHCVRCKYAGKPLGLYFWPKEVGWHGR